MRDFKQIVADAHNSFGDFPMTSSEVLATIYALHSNQGVVSQEDVVSMMECARTGDAQFYGRKVVLRDI